MTSTSGLSSEQAARRRKAKAVHERERARRQEARERAKAKADASAQAARREGRFVRVVTPGGDEMLDVIELADADGRRASVSPGVVEFINAPGRAYDYRITIDVETTLVRREAGPGQAVIAVDSDRHAHAYATEVATIRRQGGEPFSVRKMKDERVGELVRQAVGELTTHADGRHGMAEASAREMLRGEQKKRAAAPSAMTVVVEADRRAAETGEPVWEVTRRALESAHEAHSLATVKKLRARAMAEGLIPTRRPGRPRHGT